MADEIKNRKTQLLIFLASSAVAACGIFELVRGDYDDLFRTSNYASRGGPIIIFYFLAVIMVFFSARNLLKRE